MRQRVCAVLSGTPSSNFRLQLAFALAGAVHVEFWRRFFEGRYQCFLYNERNDRGSISLVSLSCVCVIRTSCPDRSKMRSCVDEVTLVQRLGEAAIFLKT